MTTDDGDNRPGTKRLQPDVSNALSRELKQTYSQLLTDPVPERFLELLRRLEKKEVDETASDACPPTPVKDAEGPQASRLAEDEEGT